MPRELRPENSVIYPCRGCGEPMHVRQPRGLRGWFYHLRCFQTVRRLSYGVLDAGVIS